jgi:hypothetical protein
MKLQHGMEQLVNTILQEHNLLLLQLHVMKLQLGMELLASMM